MPAIQFTQYCLPDGRAKTVFIDRPGDIAEKAKSIIRRGLSLECEVLATNEVSFTVTHPEEGDLECEIVPNGPDVPAAVDRLIIRYHDKLNA